MKVGAFVMFDSKRMRTHGSIMNFGVTLVVVLAAVIELRAQNPNVTPTEIFWQPGSRIEYSDYQSTDKGDCIKFKEKYGFQMSANIQIRSVVDVPRKRGEYDKFYMAPVFCKNCSCIISEDSLHLKVDRLLFDFAELSVRGARRELLELRKEMNTDNTYSTFLETAKAKWDEQMRSFFGTVLAEVLIDKKEGAYQSWRGLVDSLLIVTAPFTTSADDCRRLATNEPIEKGYKMAKQIVGDLRKNEDK